MGINLFEEWPSRVLITSRYYTLRTRLPAQELLGDKPYPNHISSVIFVDEVKTWSKSGMLTNQLREGRIFIV